MGAGSRTTATISCWIKSDFYRAFFIDAAGGSSNSLETSIYMSTSSIGVGRYDSSWGQVNGSNRDPAAWYHVMWVLDTNNSTGSDRIRVYVNGVRRTFSFSFTPSQGENLGWNNSAPVYIGHRQQIPDSSGDYYWGYLAEMHHVDGTALDPTDFGELDNNGVWRPIEVSGLTYGTNGFYLKFDPSATNGIGHDHSGNGNNFTPTGFTTSGIRSDVMSDTPTNNWATLNAAGKQSGVTLSEGNLKLSSSSNDRAAMSTQAYESGKYYLEFVSDQTGSMNVVGFALDGSTAVTAFNTNHDIPLQTGFWGFTQQFYVWENGSPRSVSLPLTTKYQMAVDFDNGKFWYGDAGSWYNSGNPATGANATGTFTPSGRYFFVVQTRNTSNSITVNFGAHGFEYTPPTGFDSAASTSALPAPDIKDGSKYFKPLIYLPDGSSSFSVTGVGFQPDLVWIKSRNYNEDHQVNDSLRGATKALQTNIPGTEVTQSNGLTSFDSDGFTVGNLSDYNYNGDSIISWNWKEGTANGLDIVSYEGTGSTQTISHNLGVPPAFVIVKTLDNGRDWYCYHQSLGAGKTILLSYNGGEFSSTNYWNNTAPSSTVFTVGSDVGTNELNNTYIAYCFAEVEGFSKFGSYIGNGSTDGPFVYCGFKPALIIYKRSDASGAWWVYDSARSPGNGSSLDFYIRANSDLSETNDGAYSSGEDIDLVANGFKVRDSGGDVNVSGSNYIFMTWASSPFGGSGVSPATAR